MRGDRPEFPQVLGVVCMFTPHARGSTERAFAQIRPNHVYPACAGIDRLGGVSVPLPEGLPRMRGDRP